MLSQYDALAIAATLEAVADIQVKIDDQDSCIEFSVTNHELSDLRHLTWQGHPWAESVIPDHRSRAVDALERARKAPGTPVRVDLNHQWAELGTELPMSYRLVADATAQVVIAIGQDLRALSNLRQQLLNAQQSMERDYWSMRQMENRYRRITEMVSDGLLVVDESSGRILEANSLARELLTGSDQSIIGRTFPLGFDEQQEPRIVQLLAEARNAGSSSVSHLKSVAGGTELSVDVTFIRQGTESRFLIALSGAISPMASDEEGMMAIVDAAPDAIIQLDQDGRILEVNDVFIEWTQASSEDQIIGKTADTWIGRSTVDMSVLLNNLRKETSIKLYASVLRNNYGVTTDIEISTARIDRDNVVRYVLFIRDIAHRISTEQAQPQHLPRSIDQITRRVGRVPLKELVRESTDVIEALCIEAALKLTKDNRASAAELLGLSRQSLYTKLRRYGIGDSDAESAPPS